MQINIKLPENCLDKEILLVTLKETLSRKAEILDINIICDVAGAFVQVTYNPNTNDGVAEKQMEEVVSNHKPIQEGEKKSVKISLGKRKFQTVIFERRNGRFQINVLMGNKGQSKKTHIFLEPNKPQRHEITSRHLSPSQSFDPDVGWQHLSVTDGNFQACVYIENTDLLELRRLLGLN